MIPRLLVVGLLLGHGLIHAAYLAPRPPVTAGGPTWPFELAHSRLLAAAGIDDAQARLVGLALVALTVAGFSLAAVAGLGVVPAALWTAGVVVGGTASLGVLILFFQPILILGMAIDIAVLWVALVAHWTPSSLID